MSIQLPDYWQARPKAQNLVDLRAGFDRLLEISFQRGPEGWIDYQLEAPKWQFLCYAAEERGLALHGSLNTDIQVFEPRQPTDLREFGAQRAVFAAGEGIWPMYFAILDRERYPTTLMNGCIRIEAPKGVFSPPYYFFSVGRHVLGKRPWSRGAVYLLPRETFTPEPPIPFGEAWVHTAQLASPEAVRPLARLEILPEDFPFLDSMYAHDEDRIEEYARALNEGLPWPETG